MTFQEPQSTPIELILGAVLIAVIFYGVRTKLKYDRWRDLNDFNARIQREIVDAGRKIWGGEK